MTENAIMMNAKFCDEGGWSVKKLMLALLLATLVCLLSGCGMILVEDSQPVRVGGEIQTED